MRISRVLLCALSIAAFGCTWVPLSAGGEQVQLANAKFVEGCQQVGKTRAKTKPTILGLKRSASTLRKELSSLARNDAAGMGGTTISPLDDMDAGEQTFGIYVCTGAGGVER